MSRRSIAVADSKLHAQAAIRWLGLKEENWDAVAYGEELTDLYQDARIIRPLEGVKDAHLDWLMETLIPRIARRATPFPATWSFNRETRDDTAACMALP